MTLPDAGRSLVSYERYYALSEDRIEAVYLPAGQGTGRVHLTNSLPQPRATGCSVVNIVFDRASGRFERILCNDAQMARTEPRLPIVRADALKMERG